jgi:serine/threonine protein kinase
MAEIKIPLRRGSKLIPPADIVISSAKRATKKLHNFNVTHRNLCVENLLWSTELQCVMIVDFGTSVLLDNPDFCLSLKHYIPSNQQ